MRLSVAWLRTLGGALAAVYLMTAAHAQTALDRPMGEVQAVLGKILGCSNLEDWAIAERAVYCATRSTGISTILYRDSADGTAETIETGGDLEWGDNRIPNQRLLSRQALHKIFDYLFPRWEDRGRWLDLALCNVMARKRTIEKLGNITILVEPEVPADLPVISAGIYVTKQSSLEQWTDGRNGVAPKGRCAPRMPPNR
ncbi:MAG: hypothetical protein JO128_09695 [Alphaproteobacteria bacterium]|nr:hypothetical protein [Alphaproteobacteria bacterium]